MSDVVFSSSVLKLTGARCPAGLDYWLGSSASNDPRQLDLQDHADIVYSLYLVGKPDMIDRRSAERFIDMLKHAPLHGRPLHSPERQPLPSAHLTAYALGAARLLHVTGHVDDLSGLAHGWDLGRLVDERMLPIWPRKWTHHIWRVSHWIGGIPSILLQLAHYGHGEADETFVGTVLSACERHIVDADSGLLRPYRSRSLQAAFRTLYRLRHDPDLGDLGGVVHLLWIHHAMDRPYVGADALNSSAWLQMQRSPFIEAVPYCLDFDIVQLVRTTLDAADTDDDPVVARSLRFAGDVLDFLKGEVPDSYSLHKLPGALATMHECALIAGRETLVDTDIAPVDIIKSAFWI